MKKLTSLAAIIVALAGCAAAAQPASTPIEIAQSDEQMSKAEAARWVIEAWEGRGIPGSPGANTTLPDARNFLQHVVDSCELGRAILAVATDGVVLLHIENKNLTNEQVQCLRGFERPGFIVQDRQAG